VEEELIFIVVFSLFLSLSESNETALSPLTHEEENMTKIIRHAEERATNYHNLAF
jgi:hypothetical protein